MNTGLMIWIDGNSSYFEDAKNYISKLLLGKLSDEQFVGMNRIVNGIRVAQVKGQIKCKG
ncbi:MAG: hypothetical protein QOC61_291 [Acidobacteriota bacterium]|nr:hypothetical protein [Acidobacteriota bacterium]